MQVKNCDMALAHGTGGALPTRHGSATLILERTQQANPVRVTPGPQPDVESQPFWDACNRGQFLLGHIARRAARNHFQPRTICPFCFSDDTEWNESSGQATIYSSAVSCDASAATMC